MTTQSKEIGWHFPPTGGGVTRGFNDIGMATFSGSPLESLTREVLQNSLDAHDGSDQPVHLVFELCTVPAAAFGAEQLAHHLRACLEAAGGNKPAQSTFEQALQIVKQNRIRCLRISDRNTIGLIGNRWDALVKSDAVSEHENNQVSGGSHGTGKRAAYIVTPLRTVGYWSCFDDDGERIERFQARSILMSHQLDDGERLRWRQETGFYGPFDDEECKAFEGDSIPDAFRVLSRDGTPTKGTAVWIPGFNSAAGWQRNIAQSVLANFFHAIQTGSLTVDLEPDGAVLGGEFEVTASTISDLFEHLANESEDDLFEESLDLKHARHFARLTADRSPTVSKVIPALGECKLWIEVADDLPRRVALIRRTGMLITTNQTRLRQFHGYQPFAAVCVVNSPEGNELLRAMEDPQHRQFEPHRLKEREQVGARALKDLATWIREEVKKRAVPGADGSSTVIDELAELLPDRQSDEPLLGSPRDESGQQRRHLRVNDPPKPPVHRPSSSESVPIHNVRHTIDPNNHKRMTISFEPAVSALARIRIEEAGDGDSLQRDDLEVLDPSGTPAQLANVTLEARKPLRFVVVGDDLTGRAWRISAVKVKSQ